MNEYGMYAYSEENIRPHLNKDVIQVMADVRNIKSAMAQLDQDLATWDREQEMNDVDGIFNQVRQLKKDLSIMTSDYFASQSQLLDNMSNQELHQVFTGLSTLFDDLKEMRTLLKVSYLNPDRLNMVWIDWKKMIKTIETLQDHFIDLAHDMPSLRHSSYNGQNQSNKETN